MRMTETEAAEWVALASGATRIWVRRGYEEHAPRLGLLGAPEADAGWVRGGRAAHPIVTLAGGERAVVRAYLRGGVLRRLNPRRYFRGNRAWEELRAAERARQAGVRTAPVLAAALRRLRVGYTAFIATRWIHAGRDAAAWLRGAPAEHRTALWGAAGRQIGRMHAGGIAHPDLNLHNLLVVDAARAGCEVYLLDFDRARLFRGTVPGSRRGSDLRRLARSARKLGVPLEAGSVAALRAGYGGGWPESAGTLG